MTQQEETKEQHKSYSTFAVVGGSILIAFILSLVIFLVRFSGISFSDMNPFADHTKKTFSTLYEEGLPHEGLKKLQKLTPKERNKASNLLWQGKLAFLATWKEYNDSSWDHYAENPDDWFHSKVLDGGIQALHRCLKLDNTRNEALLYLGLIYFEKGQYDKAEEYYKTLLQENPDDELGILNYAVLRSRQARYKEAVHILETGVEKHPRNSNFLKNLFWIYRFHLDDTPTAIDYANRFLLSMEKGDPDKTKVIRELRDIISRFPEYDSDTLVIHKDEPPEFTPRKSAERMRLRNRMREKGN